MEAAGKILRAVAPDIFLFRLAIPLPLRTVNCYFIRGDHGWTIVDPGMKADITVNEWLRVAQLLDGDWRQIEKIIITHLHPDHFGLAGWLQQRSGAPVYMFGREWARCAHVWTPAQGTDHAAWFRRHGMPLPWCQELDALHCRALSWVEPLPTKVIPVADGERLRLGRDYYRTIRCPGHSDGQMILVSDDRGVMFAGDHVLPGITPNISAFSPGLSDPLAAYLGSLQNIRDLDVQLILPGHGEPFTRLASRVDELRAHHRRRLVQFRDEVREPISAWVVNGKVFGPPQTPDEALIATGETVAHLQYLVGIGELNRRDHDAITYSAV